MNPIARRLIVVLRVAYIVGASLFLLDVLLGVVANFLIDTEPFATLDSSDLLEPAMEWVAVIAFAFAALGAVVTVVATSELLRSGAADDPAGSGVSGSPGSGVSGSH